MPSEETRAFAEKLAHLLPKHHKKPKFWADFEVRCSLIELHRQIGIGEARASLMDLYGPTRTPSHSAIHRFWQQLDRARRVAARGR